MKDEQRIFSNRIDSAAAAIANLKNLFCIEKRSNAIKIPRSVGSDFQTLV